MLETNRKPALRPAVEADRDAIADIWHGSASLPGVGPPVMPTRAEMRDCVDVELASGWAATVAVDENGKIVGFMAIKPQCSVLAELFIAPEAIGAGIGQMLLAQAMAEMPMGFTLFTRPASTRARTFYAKAGLVEIGEDVHIETRDPIIYYQWRPR